MTMMFIDGLLVIFLIFGIRAVKDFYEKYKEFSTIHSELKSILRHVTVAMKSAKAATDELKENIDFASDHVIAHLPKSKTLTEDLKLLCEEGEKIADRIENLSRDMKRTHLRPPSMVFDSSNTSNSQDLTAPSMSNEHASTQRLHQSSPMSNEHTSTQRLHELPQNTPAQRTIQPSIQALNASAPTAHASQPSYDAFHGQGRHDAPHHTPPQVAYDRGAPTAPQSHMPTGEAQAQHYYAQAHNAGQSGSFQTPHAHTNQSYPGPENYGAHFCAFPHEERQAQRPQHPGAHHMQSGFVQHTNSGMQHPQSFPFENALNNEGGQGHETSHSSFATTAQSPVHSHPQGNFPVPGSQPPSNFAATHSSHFAQNSPHGPAQNGHAPQTVSASTSGPVEEKHPSKLYAEEIGEDGKTHKERRGFFTTITRVR